jgi:peptidoglycan/xylan/chitin deacetylase (PgdA/CDA1 family)
VNCAISIDLDGIGCYYRIHGLGASPAELEHTILERALPRAAALFAKRGVQVTWFVVGRDADADAALPDRAARAANAQRLRTLAQAGDELGNHSYSHPYDLARLGAAEVDAEITGCDRVLHAILAPLTKPAPMTDASLVQLRMPAPAVVPENGANPRPLGSGIAPHIRGFRAPGYDVSPAMLDTLARLGYRYDSSIFAAPGYYVAKAAVMAVLAAAGRPSGAVMIDPRALAAPADPYRPSMTSPWRRGQAPLVELPVAVTPWLRVPAIGTSLLVAPSWLRSRLIAAMTKRRFFNLELHGIDFADAEKDGIPGELVDRQPDLRIPIDDKLARLDAMLDVIGKKWDFVTLADVAIDAQRDE